MKQYGSNLRKFIVSVSFASLPMVQWKPPSLRVVEALVLRSVDDLAFLVHLQPFHHVAFFSVCSTNILGPFFVRIPQAMTFLRFYSK